MSMLNNLLILDEQQLKAASKDQLFTLFNQIESVKKTMEQQLVDTRVQLETKQNEYNSLLGEIKEKFGAATVEDLEAIKQKKVLELAQIGQELRNRIAETGETNG